MWLREVTSLTIPNGRKGELWGGDRFREDSDE